LWLEPESGAHGAGDLGLKVRKDQNVRRLRWGRSLDRLQLLGASTNNQFAQRSARSDQRCERERKYEAQFGRGEATLSAPRIQDLAQVGRPVKRMRNQVDWLSRAHLL
jgi:hypothetical protein